MLTPAPVSPKIRRCLPKSQLAPWQAEVYRLVSWWDVERFAAHRFYALGLLLEAGSANLDRRAKENPDQVLAYAVRHKLIGDLELVEKECLKLALVNSSDTVQEFKEQLNWKNRKWKAGEARTYFDHISGSIRREMKRTLFMYIPRERAHWFLEPLKDWETVTSRYPDTIHDIEEAGKSFACDRFDATVVHMMLVAEFGAMQIGRLLEINDPKLGWPRVSQELKRITSAKFPELNAIEKKHFPFLEQISPLMLAMQNAWRHKVSHAESRLVLLKGEFQPYVAEEIILATRAFMRRLATELPKSNDSLGEILGRMKL
jgi:hypothetical protein